MWWCKYSVESFDTPVITGYTITLWMQKRMHHWSRGAAYVRVLYTSLVSGGSFAVVQLFAGVFRCTGGLLGYIAVTAAFRLVVLSARVR